jgi:hypothetical protein
LKEITDQK